MHRLQNTTALLDTYRHAITQGEITVTEITTLCDTSVSFQSSNGFRLQSNEPYHQDAYRTQDAIVDFIAAIGPELDDETLHLFVGKLLVHEMSLCRTIDRKRTFMRSDSVAKCFLAYEAGRCRNRTRGLPESLRKNITEHDLIVFLPLGTIDVLSILDPLIVNMVNNIMQNWPALDLFPFHLDPFSLSNFEGTRSFEDLPLQRIENLPAYTSLIRHGQSLWRERGVNEATRAKALAIAKLKYAVERGLNAKMLESMLTTGRLRNAIIENRGTGLYRFFCCCCGKESTSHGCLRAIERELARDASETDPFLANRPKVVEMNEL